ARQHWPALINGEIPPDWPLTSWVTLESMINAYGGEHARLRRLAAKAFTARRVQAMRPLVEKIVVDLLDELAGHAPGEVVDLRDAFANQVPARVICDLLGVTGDTREVIRRSIATFADTTTTPDQAMAAAHDQKLAIRALIALKRQTPGDDLTSA